MAFANYTAPGLTLEEGKGTSARPERPAPAAEARSLERDRPRLHRRSRND